MLKLRWLLAISLALPASSGAQEARFDRVTQYQIKAAFLYNFAKFVEWPEDAFTDPADPVVIGILGKDPFGDDLDAMVAGKTVKGRKLVVKRFRRVGDLQGCHILFVSQSQESEIQEIIDKVNDLSVLTVGEAVWFAAEGGIINLVNRDNKVRFEINLEACHRARLKISSRLLRLAEIIRDRYANRTME